MDRPGMTGASVAIDVATIPEIGGRVWGPDLFAWAYDGLMACDGWRGQDDPAEMEHRERVIRWRDRIRDADGWVPAPVISEIQDQHRAEDAAELALELVVAIDRAYAGVRVTRPCIVPATGSIAALVEEWEIKGSLEKAVDGLVVRKGSFWRQGSALSHYCDDLGRVPASVARRVGIARYARVWSLGNHLRQQGETATIRIAFLPTLYEIADLSIAPAGDRRFAVELNPATQTNLERAVSETVVDLEDREVNIALLPETAASSSYCAALKDALVANFARIAAEGGRPKLRLVVVGRCAPRSNSACVFGADGELLFEQRKTQRWRLDATQIRRYDLEGDLGPKERSEDIDEESMLTFLDDPGLGRVVVLICEDLARGDPWVITAAATPTVVLSPVLDGGLTDTRWAYLAARRIADEPGSLVAVANSFILGLRERAVRGERMSDAMGVGLICHPDDWDQTEVVRSAPRPGQIEIRDVTWPQAWA